MSILESVRAEARRAPPSGIAAVMAYGRGRPGLIPLWVGEGDLPTPAFISDAAVKALRDGETFYTWQGGIPELREALARYHARHFGQSFSRDEFLVVGSGMQAIQLALQATAGAGDEVICLSPAWPNFAGGGRGRRRQGGLGPPRSVRQWLVLRRRQDRGRRDRPHARDLRQLAGEPDRLDRRSRHAAGDPRPRPPPQSVDHRRRDLCAVPL